MNRASDVDGRIVDRDDAFATPLGEAFHSNDYARNRGRCGQGGIFSSKSASALIDRILFEIAEEDEVMEKVGMTPRRWYAEDLRLQAHVRRNLAIVEAFAVVARE